MYADWAMSVLTKFYINAYVVCVCVFVVCNLLHITLTRCEDRARVDDLAATALLGVLARVHDYLVNLKTSKREMGETLKFI